MKIHQKKKITITGMFCLCCMLLIIIPVHGAADTGTVNFVIPINPDPNRSYGEEFRSAGSPYGSAFYIAFGSTTSWTFAFFLTQAQADQLDQWRKNNGTMPMIDAFERLVPDQVHALPEALRNYLYEHWQMQLNPETDPAYSHDNINDIWTDPSGTAVPATVVPRNIYTHDIPGVPLYGEVHQYTSEVQSHLANMGLATGYDAADLSVSTSIPGGQYTITFEGNTPSGVRKSWTFVLDNNGTWHDSKTGEVMDIDAQYVLAALMYVNPPGQSYSASPPMTTAINFTATGLARNTVQSLTPGLSSVSSRFGNTLSPLTQGSAAVKIPAYTMNPILSSSLNHSSSTVSFPSDVFPASQIKNSNKVNSSQRSIVLLKTYTKNFTYA
jgi:hypothetical protein